jgi:hypothetical protein
VINLSQARASDFQPSTGPDRKKNKKTAKSATAAYEAERQKELVIDTAAEPTRDRILSEPNIAKASKEYEAAQTVIAEERRLSIALPSPKTNMFARRLSKIGEEDEEQAETSKAATVEESSDSEDAYAEFAEKYTGASTPDYYRLGSLVPYTRDDEEQDRAPLTSFTRRLSSATLALANSEFDGPGSDYSGTTEEIPRNPVALADNGAQSEFASSLLQMMQRMVQDHEETRWTTEELLLANKLEAQRLATLIATQPPSAPPPVDSRQEVETWNRIAYENQKYGALQAFATYSKLLCGDNTTAFKQIMQPLVHAPEGDLLKLLADNQAIQPQERPDRFFSTRSLMSDKLRRTPGVMMTMDGMYHILKGNEMKYQAAFQSCRLGRELGGTKSREDNPSQYPLLNRLLREREQQQQQQQQPAQTVFLNTPNFGQQIVIQQDFAERKASWAMMDVSDLEYDSARK